VIDAELVCSPRAIFVLRLSAQLPAA